MVMNESDKQIFQVLMVGAGELYGKEVTKPLLRIYFNALEDLTIDQVSDAFSKHVKSTSKDGSFFPKPADLMRQIKGSDDENKSDLEGRAMVAWACIDEKLRKCSSYETLHLEDKQALAAVKALGGWRKLCLTTYDQMPWVKKEFLKLYETFERTPIDRLPSSLPGIHEIEQHKKEGAHALGHLMDEFKRLKVDNDE